jgi:hypothetical protein
MHAFSTVLSGQYGADVEEVRGFLQGGWHAMANHDGPGVREKSPYCHISTEVRLPSSLSHGTPEWQHTA